MECFHVQRLEDVDGGGDALLRASPERSFPPDLGL